jgi:hypothetical protein
LSERELLGSGKLTDDEKRHMGIAESLKKRRNPPEIDALRIWLGKARDALSWTDLAEKNQKYTYAAHPGAAMSYVRRAYRRVEQYLVGIQSRHDLGEL